MVSLCLTSAVPSTIEISFTLHNRRDYLQHRSRPGILSHKDRLALSLTVWNGSTTFFISTTLRLLFPGTLLPGVLHQYQRSAFSHGQLSVPSLRHSPGKHSSERKPHQPCITL